LKTVGGKIENFAGEGRLREEGRSFKKRVKRTLLPGLLFDRYRLTLKKRGKDSLGTAHPGKRRRRGFDGGKASFILQGKDKTSEGRGDNTGSALQRGGQ